MDVYFSLPRRFFENYHVFPFRFPFLSLLERDEARIHAHGSTPIQMPIFGRRKLIEVAQIEYGMENEMSDCQMWEVT